MNKTFTIEQMIAEQVAERKAVLDSCDRSDSAKVLAEMAIHHSGSGAYAAAHLLMAMEYGTPFKFELLLSLDSTNRAHADIIIMGYRSHEVYPSLWMDEKGHKGSELIQSVRRKWIDE